MEIFEVKRETKKYTNILKDTTYIDAVSQWAIKVCDLDELRTSEPIVEVNPLKDGSAEIIVSYQAFKPTRFQSLYYKYWVGIPVANFAKMIREN